VARAAHIFLLIELIPEQLLQSWGWQSFSRDRNCEVVARQVASRQVFFRQRPAEPEKKSRCGPAFCEDFVKPRVAL
jgi:hypothetical protein